ncbi:MAG TPA: gliding motility protein GldM [Ferruginibacter sp.]|nr:gliding motility protein GldM [Chitinophagaceae bacterium]HRI23603.1 gliding motility protein GldM [Ferruginibacter sp.]
MALPREPRQKMINIMYLVLTAILALNVSAEVIEAFKTVDKSLLGSTTSITKANDVLYKSLNEKLADPQSAEKAKIWQPKALQAQELSSKMAVYIDQLKEELKMGAGKVMKEKNGVQVEDFKEDNLDASTRLFETNGKGPDLEKRLKDYKEAMLNIDPSIRKEFESNFAVSVDVPKGQEGKVKSFTTTYFHMTPTVAALTMLSKFQNNIKNAENQVVTYCHNQIGAVKLIYDKFQPIAGGSSTYLMPGEEMVVTAGVGAFNAAAKPTITINGAVTALNENGVAEKKFNVSGGGKQKVHVVITYTKPDGTPDKLEKDIEYTVGTPGGAAVMLDKMNVFYIGVDNPVTIGSTTGWDRTNVTISGAGATISGQGSKRIVKVSSIGDATINVTADNKTTSFKFRVKRIPDPIIKVGPSGGGRVQAVVFRNQQFVRADLENFDFEAKFAVTGATIYFNTPGDRNVKSVTLSNGSLAGAKAFMDQLVPGSTVTFDNIRVVGPDGQTRTIQNPPGFSLF